MNNMGPISDVILGILAREVSKELARSFQFLLWPKFWVPKLHKRCWMLL